MSAVTWYPARQYAVVRVLLGLHLAIYFAGLIPHASDVYGPSGLFREADPTPFPNPLMVDSPVGPPLFMISFAVVSLGFAVGLWRRFLALLLWYGWACLINRLPFIRIPSEGYVGWLLLASALIPAGETWAPGPRAAGWQLPTVILVGAWIIQALSYSVSGVGKLWSPSWIEGSALSIVLDSALVRPSGLAPVFLGLPPPVLKLCTWGFLGLEVAFAPLSLTAWGRKYAWAAMVVVHLCMLVLLDITAVSVGMLIVHAFTFDIRWLPGPASPSERPPV